jgi:hypothetical protein
MRNPRPQRAGRNVGTRALLNDLVSGFRRSGWERIRRSALASDQPDVLIKRDDEVVVVDVKLSPDGRRDRLVPLLAQAILDAQASARGAEGVAVAPLAVVGAPRISDQRARELLAYAAAVAPAVMVGVIDAEGRRRFSDDRFEGLNAEPRRSAVPVVPVAMSGQLVFSDLNQWLLKVLLAPRIPEPLLRAPRARYRNVSELARAADVSVMSAWRLVSQLRSGHFLDDSARELRVLRADALLARWQAAVQGAWQEVALRWIIRGDPSRQLEASLRKYGAEPPSPAPRRAHHRSRPRPRICLALFEAADALGVGLVHGAPRHLYLEALDPGALHALGLMESESADQADVRVRIPRYPNAVFRGAVIRHGLPVADVLQVWLDVAGNPARGQEQADHIRRRVFGALLAGGNP